MTVIGEILDWSKNLPDWQSDALRRIWINGHVAKEDETQALKLLKFHHGLLSSKDVGFVAERFAASHVGSATVHGHDTVLKTLRNVKNVNALRDNQQLDFGISGVTVIYGDNATGKSGYSRVLKRACRARGVAERIYPNVYSAGIKSSGPAEATFDVAIQNIGDQTVMWKDGLPSPSSLANIAVFDSKVARVHVDEANEVTYVPYGLDVFTKLATLCLTLKDEIQKLTSALPPIPPAVTEFVGIGKLISAITSETDVTAINTAAIFSNRDQSRLDQLAKIVADYRANDPLKKAQSWRRRKSRIDRIQEAMSDLQSKLSYGSVKQLHKLYDEFKIAIEAADLASKNTLGSEPLPGTGNSVWKIMFEAARRYSEQSAYPNLPFPITAEGSRCVLCQQELGPDARDRLKRFSEFIEQDVAKSVNDCQMRMENASQQLKQIDPNPLKADPQLIGEIRELSESDADELESSITSAGLRIIAIEKAMSDGTWDAIPPLSVYPSSGLLGLSEQCEADAQAASTMAKPEEQARSESALASLTTRKKLSENKQSLLDYLETLKVKKKLNDCLDALNTKKITDKQSELMVLALTIELESALKREFESLGIEYLPLRVTKTGRIGSTFHKLVLPAYAQETAGLSEVLSEGEHRVVAIASFLAELSIARHKCGIIFDDPVSSLDQRWRERVARRLTKEGQLRQVIIFTHDIAFLVALRSEAGAQQVPFLTQMVTCTPSEFGICNPRSTNPMMDTKERIGILKQMHQVIAACHKKYTEEEYRPKVDEFYDLLRSAWERAVEEHLLRDVVYRFRPAIETKKLKGVVVEDQDCIDITNGMTRCSQWIGGHDHAGGLGSSVPSPQELEADLKSFEEFYLRVKKRGDDVAEIRKSKLVAPKPGNS